MAHDADWTDEELRASVEAYASIHRADQEGRRVNKSQIYRDLEARFARSNKSFERRMQNISYVVVQLGGTYVRGLKPLSHIGPAIQPKIERLVKEAGFLGSSNVIQANTTLALEPKEADSRANELQKQWKESGDKVLPPRGFMTADTFSAQSTQRKRCAEVKAWVLLQADGVCEMCNSEAPFTKDGGEPYLEVHHVVQLANDVPDTTENAIAVCPNCHRALHFADNRQELVELLYQRVGRLSRL